MDQPFRSLGIFRTLWYCSRENRHFLRAFGQWTDDGDTGDRLEFADLLEADVDIASRERVADSLVGFDDFALRLDLIRDSETWKQNRAKVDTAGAVG